MNERTLRLPRLYAIIDADLLASRVSPQKLIGAVCDFAQELAAGGATLFRYQAGNLSPREILSHGRELRRVLGPEALLLMDSRADLRLGAGFSVGNQDLSPDGARKVAGVERWVGCTASNSVQARDAALTVDYVALGPVYSDAAEP